MELSTSQQMTDLAYESSWSDPLMECLYALAYGETISNSVPSKEMLTHARGHQLKMILAGRDMIAHFHSVKQGIIIKTFIGRQLLAKGATSDKVHSILCDHATNGDQTF